MTFVRPLFRPLRALVLGLAVLCLLAQPVLSAAHELHDLEHAMSDAAMGGDSAIEESSEPGTLESLLHAFDCCLHATALTGAALAWTPPVLGDVAPQTDNPTASPSPLSRFLRPPISA